MNSVDPQEQLSLAETQHLGFSGTRGVQDLLEHVKLTTIRNIAFADLDKSSKLR